MKKYIFLFILAPLLFVSCSSTNKIYVKEDTFKDKTTIKLNQSLNAYSDESRKGLGIFPDYYILLKHFYSTDSLNATLYNLDVKINTTVRAYEVDPVLFISIDGEGVELEASEVITKMYQQGSSSTSSETSVTVSDDSGDEEQAEVETSTTYTTTSSHNTYQLMQLSFSPDLDLMKQISKSNRTDFRLYIKNEAIDAPLKKRNRRKFNKYVELITGEV